MASEPEQGAPSSPDRPEPSWTVGRVIGTIFTGIGGLIGLVLLLGGIAVIAVYAFGRDDDGYFNTDRKELRSAAYAITSGEIHLGADELDWAPDQVLGDVRIQVESESPVFVGIGPDEDVARYLGDVAHDELTGFDGDRPELALQKGKAPGAPPGRKRFWAARSEAVGEQALTWDADFGRWTAVVMNADGSRGVAVEADAGVKLSWAIWAGLGMLVIGLLMTAGAVAVILLIGRSASRSSPPATA